MGNDQSLLCSESPPQSSRRLPRSAKGIIPETPYPVTTNSFKSKGSLSDSIGSQRNRSGKDQAMISMIQKDAEKHPKNVTISHTKSSSSNKTQNDAMPHNFIHMDIGNEKTGTFRGIQAPAESSLLPCILFTFFYPHESFDKYLLRAKPHKTDQTNSASGSENISKIRGIIENRIIHNMRTYPYFSSHNEWNFLEDLYSKDLSKMNKDPEYAFDFLFSQILQIKGFLEFNKFETGFLHQLLCPRSIGNATNIRISDLISFKTSTAPALCSPFLILEIKRISYNTPFVFPMELDLQVSDPSSKGQLELYAVICIPPHDHGSWKAFVRTKNDTNNLISWQFYDPQSQGLMDSCQYNIPKVELLPDFEEHVQYLRTSKTATANSTILRDGSVIGQRLKTLLHLGHLFIYYDPDDPRLGNQVPRPKGQSKREKSSESNPCIETKGTQENVEKQETTKQTSLETPKPKAIDKPMLSTKETPIQSVLTKSASLPTKVKEKSPVVEKSPHISNLNIDHFRKLFISQYKDGKGVGLEGRGNSCFLDSLLFSMFYISKIFDDWLLLPKLSTNPESRFGRRIRNILLFDIVDNLRGNHFVPYESVAKLREAVGEVNPRLLGSNMMDVEELITTLLGKALELKKLINYSIGTSTFVHQIAIDRKLMKDDVTVTDIQSLFEVSMQFQNLKLAGVPCPALIIKIPRTPDGKLLGWDEIVPNLTLDLDRIMNKDSNVTNTKLQLSAVIVLKNGHYTTYVRMGFSPFSQWLYFDSMPPRVKHVPQLGEELDFAQQVFDGKSSGDGKKWSRHFHRLITNIHICIYYSPETVLRMKKRFRK